MRILLVLSVVVLLGYPETVFAPPAPQPITIPGIIIGRIRTRWIAPNVSITHRVSRDANTTSVTWFDASGKVRQELSGNSLTVEPGFVVAVRDRRGIVRGVNRDWEMAMPGNGEYITATPDSRFFVQQVATDHEHLSADIYEDGKLLATVGPYLKYLGNDIQLGDDGSIAIPTWKTKEKRFAQIEAIGPDGKEKFRADCDGPIGGVFPAPNAAAVLVARGDGSGMFSLYDGTTKRPITPHGHNVRFVAWVPGTTTALMQSSVGFDSSWELIDGRSAKSLWNIHHPNPARPEWTGTTVAVTRDYVLLAEEELVNARPARSIYALETKTGKLAAHWLPSGANYPMTEGQTFLTLGEHLYLVSDSECSEIRFEDIAAHKGGWK
jgi:hypothetical protein